MADSSHFSYTKPPHFPPGERKAARKAKSFTHFLCKFLFFGLFLVAIPLFPSQAPGFISQSLLTKFWELVHLLFIGVAVSYGLFCRRNVDVDFDAQTSTSEDSESYVSTVLRVSSIFEDGFDNSCGYGDKNVCQNLYSDSYKYSESLVGSTNENTMVVEQKKTRTFDSDSGFEYSCGYGDNNVSQAWNSQYFQGESMVVVAQPDCYHNRYGESGGTMGHKSLNLPIRSLRSGEDSHEISDGCESSSCSKDSSNSPCFGGIGKEFGDMNPTNLENRFDETDSFLPVPWRSRSERMEFGGDVGVNVASRSHFRPLSVDETQFESLKSKSLWSTESFSSQASSTLSDSPNGLSPSHGVFSELENVRMEELGKTKMEELEKGKSFRRSYPPDSKQENKKASLNAFHIRRYSTNGSLFEKNSRKSVEDDSRDTSKSKREAPLSSDVGRSASSKFDGNLGDLVNASLRNTSKSKREVALSSDVGRSVSSKFDGFVGNLVNSSLKDTSKSKREAALLNSDVGMSGSPKFEGNSRNPVKASPTRGKSVRTIRSRRYTAEAMKSEERSEDHFSNKLDQKANEEVEEAVYKRKHEKKNVGSNNLSSTATKKHDLDNHSPLNTPKATSPELHKRKTRELFEALATNKSKEEPKEADHVQASSDVESVTDSVVSDAGSNTHEVDKKAGEFIAKFREQIRLQKMASIDRSKGHNYFR